MLTVWDIYIFDNNVYKYNVLQFSASTNKMLTLK